MGQVFIGAIMGPGVGRGRIIEAVEAIQKENLCACEDNPYPSPYY